MLQVWHYVSTGVPQGKEDRKQSQFDWGKSNLDMVLVQKLSWQDSNIPQGMPYKQCSQYANIHLQNTVKALRLLTDKSDPEGKQHKR